jgi:hypothetical protein
MYSIIKGFTMSNTHILAEKELNYIETLYLYCNLEDFIEYESKALDWLIGTVNNHTNRIVTKKDIDNLYANERYDMMVEYIEDNILYSANSLGFSNGREWYDLGYCRIGIMDYDLAKRSNQFNVEIQYYQSHMFSLGAKLEGLLLPFDGSFNQYHIKRIDLTKVVKTKYDYLTNHSFISSYRSISRFGNDFKTETVYLGKRKNGNVFRMYNKTIELQTDTKEHPIDYKKIEIFSKYFGDIEDLYTFELELHRKYLKSNFDIDRLSDLEKVYRVYSEVVGKIKIYEDNDYNRKMVSQKNHGRIKEFFVFTDYIEYKRVEKKKYKPSKEYLIDRIVKNINAYEKSLSVKMEEYEKIILVDSIVTSIFGNKEISIEINDSADVVEYKQFMKKIEIIRSNQDNSLFIEAKKAFSPVYAQNPKDLF